MGVIMGAALCVQTVSCVHKGVPHFLVVEF